MQFKKILVMKISEVRQNMKIPTNHVTHKHQDFPQYPSDT